MTGRIDLRKYLKQTILSERDWKVLKRLYYQLEKKELRIRHIRSKIDVKLQCHIPNHQNLPM